MDLKSYKIIVMGLILCGRSYSQVAVLPADKPKADDKSAQILHQVVQAMGGLEFIRSITTLQTRIRIRQTTDFGEVEVTGSFRIRYPDQLRSDLILPGGKVTILFNDSEGRTIVHGREPVPMDALNIQQYKKSMSRDPVVFLQKYPEWTTLYKGAYNLHGNETEDILVTSGQNRFHLLIDSKTMLPAGVRYQENGKKVDESYFDYQCFDGYWLPARTMTYMDGEFFSETHRLECQLNAPISSQWFEIDKITF